MYFFLGLISFLVFFNSPINILPLERSVLEITPGQNSVLIIFPSSIGLYSALNDSVEYYSIDDDIHDAVNIHGTDTYLLFGKKSIFLLNKYLFQFYEINTGGHAFNSYYSNKSIYLKDSAGRVFLLNINSIIPADTDFIDWNPIKSNNNVTRFPQLAPYYISKGNNIYHYSSAAQFRNKLFAGTDNFGLFIIDKYSGIKLHILNGILGNIKGIKSLEDGIIIYSNSDIAILKDKHLSFLLDTLFFYPHFQDNIGDVEIYNDTLYFSGEYSIYYVINEGIYKIINSSFKINSFLFHNGILYYATDNGVTGIANNKQKKILSDIAVFDIVGKGNFLFFATERGIYAMNNKKIVEIKQFPKIAYKELAINDVSISAISFDNTAYFMSFTKDGVINKRINAYITRGNICSLDSQFIYISGNLIYSFPGNNVYPLFKYDNKKVYGISIIKRTAYIIQNNVILFLPVNDVFPALSNR